jgi:Protein of unknown function (DUF4231)
MRPPSLVRWFPRLRAPADFKPVIPVDQRDAYPSLAADIDVLDREVAPRFRACDLAALAHQNRHRRQQVVVLLGSALLTGLGGVQAIIPHQRWPGILLTLLAVALAASARWMGERHSLTRYLEARVKAERLRALHFLYLARIEKYGKADRDHRLKEAVVAITAGKEPT